MKKIVLILLAVLFLCSLFGVVSVNAQTGGLIVVTEPVSGKIYIDDSYKGEGYYHDDDCPIGTYKITFGNIPGYITPAMKMAVVTPGKTKTVRAIYEPLPYPAIGTISITTAPIAGEIYIDDVYVGTGSFSGEYESGGHRVSFGDVVGYTTPNAQLVVVTSGTITTVPVTYTLSAPLAPIIQLYSTRTTITSQQPGLLTISAVNPMKNPVMTAETIFTVPLGVEIVGVGTPFVSSGAGQYIGKFIVLPEEQKHYTISVRALKEDITSFTVEALTIYDFGSGRPLMTEQNTITFDVVPPPPPTPVPTPIPPPVSTKTENSSTTETENSSSEFSSPGFEAVFTVACLIIIAHVIKKRKRKYV